MCGLAGFWDTLKSRPQEELAGIARGMADTLAHRGPDADGVWADQDSGLALSHRRLSILDLSPEGAQPMASASGRYLASYNGEIYNYRDIRAELEKEAGGPLPWRGHSDTEVMLAAFEAWGVEKTLVRMNGMFALALWDRAERALHLARDRMGKKPLYYGWWGGAFLFASELKACRAFPGCAPELDREAVALFLRHACVPWPHCVYKNFRKLPPAGWLTLQNPRPGELSPARRYWSLDRVVARGAANPLQEPAADTLDRIEVLLNDAVAIRMISDVPLGSLLSGGVDSSLITALMARQGAGPVKTFTIGFDQAGFNEAEHAKAVAAHLGAEHHELYLNDKDALAVVPRLPALFDEPFADSSQIPTFLVSRLARGSVTVGLGGDGGDEVFSGYSRYLWGARVEKLKRLLPGPLAGLASRVITGLPTRVWAGLFGAANRVLPASWKKDRPADNLSRVANALGRKGSLASYRALVSLWDRPEGIIIGAGAAPTVFDQPAPPALEGDLARLSQYLDTVSYLPDDILVKVDRASMGVSLECRAPLLDYRLVELSWRLPLSFLRRDGVGKWPLRQLLHRQVPRHLVDRPKSGFGVPLAGWLRGELKDWASDLLSPARLQRQGLLKPGPVAAMWQEHRDGRLDWHHHLWALLMLQAWLDGQ